jgi:hypothetical protein
MAVCDVSSPAQSCYFLIPVKLLLSFANKDLLQFRSYLFKTDPVPQFITQCTL